MKIKDCPIYEQLCAIFCDSTADGKYAQSSHYEGLEKSVGTETSSLLSCPESETPRSENPPSLPLQGNSPSGEKASKNVTERKRKHPSETQSSNGQGKRDQEIIAAMAGAMLQMVAAAKSRAITAPASDDRYSITNCIRALDEICGIDEKIYFAALDLFEDPKLREIFISLKGEQLRLTWLQGKCGYLVG